jgi:tetratricopeptide (TPR) repeat protein
MAERLAQLAWMQRREQVAVNADMVAKWERGAKGISPRYRTLLCQLFGITAEQLWLKSTSVPPHMVGFPPREDDSLVGMLDNAVRLLDQLGAAGTALAPHMLHAWKDRATTRRAMLGLLDPAASDPIGHARATTATITDFEQLAQRYQALYDTADPVALMTPVAAHLRMTTNAVHRNAAPEQRRRLLCNQAQVAILAGRLTNDDLGNPMSGRGYYGLELDTAGEIGDHHLIALAHGHAAHLAAVEGMTTAALDRLTAATEHVSSPSVVASWLAALEATFHADRGNHTPARQALDRAHAALNQPAAHPTPTSLYNSSAANLTVATGHVLLQSGDYNGARTTFAAALEESRPIPRRQRILALVDLAIAELHIGDFAAASSRAVQAAKCMHEAAYALGATRLRAFRSAADRPLSSMALRALDEHLSRIAA